ncbi:MAG: glycerophosphodiester phosphodiesterase [Candidatus Schekmanbacteria bacterium]|nr:glycerophosphodiester phosphodiesterase [Candidatus Schekmanbacteria bacterium]
MAEPATLIERIAENLLYDKARRVFDAVYAWPRRTVLSSVAAPTLVGHRGLTGHPSVVENTLGAFQLAVDRGAGFELDVRLTADDVVVVCHDASLSRAHGRSELVSALSVAELRAAAPAVPTLGEVLAQLGDAAPAIFIEVKHIGAKLRTLVGLVRDALCARGLVAKCTLISLDTAVIDVVRDVFPEATRALIFLASPRRAREYVEHCRDTGLVGWYAAFPEGCRQLLHRHGLVEGVGFINWPSTAVAFRNRGFPYLFTDRVDFLGAPAGGPVRSGISAR